MRWDPHSRRFDRSLLFPPTGTDGSELSGAPDASPSATAGESANDAAGRDFDEAIEQIDAEGCGLCPRCGAVVARTGALLG